MTKPKKVCNLELSKTLKRLGVKQDSYFYWYESSSIINKGKFVNYITTTIEEFHGGFKGEYYSAFTVEELGKLLLVDSVCMETENNGGSILIEWSLGVYGRQDQFTLYSQEAEANTEANARAIILSQAVKAEQIKV